MMINSQAVASARADAAATDDKLDQLLDGVKKVMDRIGKMEERLDACEGDMKARKDAEEKEAKAKADAARKDAVTTSADPSPEDPKLFADAQARADHVAIAFGKDCGAPRWLHGETTTEYKCRLARPYQQFSPTWKEVDLARLDSAAIDVASAQIYADAHKHANSPESVPVGMLREVRSKDDAGRTITKFIGDPEACWGPFKQAIRGVIGMRKNFAEIN